MYLTKKGNSEFKIVIEKNSDERIVFASEELKNFIFEATGVKLNTVNECKGNRIEILYNGDTNDGYRVFSKKGVITVLGNSVHGAVYGTYALLKQLIGLEFFTPTVYNINKGDVEFSDFDFSSTPDISARAVGIAPLHSEEIGNPVLKEQFRMGVRSMGDGWGLHSHSYFKILPPDIYKENHPDWYSVGDKTTLCLTNKEMRAEFIKRIKDIIQNEPNAKYFMLGQEDNAPLCTCEKCKQAIKKYGGYKSMLMLEFTNSIVKEVNVWLKNNFPKRKIEFVMFAYQETIKPAVKKCKGKYVPIFPIKIENNISVMFAPLGARANVSFFDKRNVFSTGCCAGGIDNLSTKDLFLGWQAITKKLFIWSYCIDYADSLAPFNCWSFLEKNYRWYKKLGVEYVFEEGTYGRYVPNFNALRAYVVSKLMWNTNTKIKDTINYFMKNYYGSNAFPYLKKYFNYLNSVCDKISKKRPVLFIRFDDCPDFVSSNFWKLKYLLKADKLIRNAISHADGVYKERVKDEGLSVWYMMMILYNNYFTEKRKNEISNNVLHIVNKYSLKEFCEGIVSTRFAKIEKFCIKEK